MTVHGDPALVERAAPARRPRLRYDPTRPANDRAFDAARRHTQRVRRLKILLPGLALIGAAAFYGAMRFVPTDLATIARGAGIDATSESITMTKPRISGFEGTRRAYDIQAENAVQSLSDPKVVTFNNIDASFGLDDAGTAKLNAASGTYDGNKNTMVLKGGVSVATDTGYSASVGEAAVDLGKGNLTTSVPIEIKTGQGSIRANTLNVVDRGKRIVFGGGVSVTFTPPGDLAASGG